MFWWKLGRWACGCWKMTLAEEGGFGLNGFDLLSFEDDDGSRWIRSLVRGATGIPVLTSSQDEPETHDKDSPSSISPDSSSPSSLPASPRPLPVELLLNPNGHVCNKGRKHHGTFSIPPSHPLPNFPPNSYKLIIEELFIVFTK